MKRLVRIVLYLIILVSLTACKANDSKDEFTKFFDIVKEYDIEDYNGFDYHAIQLYEEEVVHDKKIEQRIARASEIKIYTEMREQYLQEFDVEEEFHSSTTVTYFYQDKRGIQENDGEVFWKAMTLEEYMSSNFMVEVFLKEDFVTYDIDNTSDISVLTGELTTDALEKIFGIDSNVIVSNEIQIKLDIEEELLLEFLFKYESEETKTEIIFVPYRGVANVILPQQ